MERNTDSRKFESPRLKATYDASDRLAPKKESKSTKMDMPPHEHQQDKERATTPQNILTPRYPLEKQNTAPAQVRACSIIPPTNPLTPKSNNKNFVQQNLPRDWDPTGTFEKE